MTLRLFRSGHITTSARGSGSSGPNHRLQLPARKHIRQVDYSDPLPYYYATLTSWLYRHRLEMALDLLGSGPYGTILEAGCGSGILLPSLASRTARLFAVDLHRAMGFVRSMLAAEGVTASLATGNVCATGYGDLSFDALVCVSTLEHLHPAELEATVAEFKRILRPGGVVIVGIPASGWAMDLLFHMIGFSEIGDHHVSTRSTIEAELKRHFQIEAERRLPSLGPRSASLYTVLRCRR